jgi:hypothetical protein
MTCTTRTTRTCCLASVLLLLSATAAAAPARLLPAAAADLAPQRIVASPAPSTAPTSGPVRFTWPIDQAADDLTPAAPHRAESTGFTRTLTRAALHRGVSVPVSQPGALLKLSPHPGRTLAADSLVVVDPRGRVHTIGDGLRRAGSDAHAFTLDPALGSGTFVVRAPPTATSTSTSASAAATSCSPSRPPPTSCSSATRCACTPAWSAAPVPCPAPASPAASSTPTAASAAP